MPDQTPEPLTAATDLKVRAEEFLADAAETPDIEIEVRNGLIAYEEQLRNAPDLVQALLDRITSLEHEAKFMLGQANNNAKRWGTLEIELSEARNWAAWFAAEKEHWLERAALTGQRMGRRIAELEAAEHFPAGYVTGFLNDQDRVTGLEHVSYSTRVQAVERAEYRRPSIPGVAVYALRKVSE